MKAIYMGLTGAFFAIIPLVAGCGSDERQLTRSGAPGIDAGSSVTPRSTGSNKMSQNGNLQEVDYHSETSPKPTVLFLGTSLTAGYGLSEGQAFPTLVGRKADSAGKPITVINAGISGETSAGLLSRIDWTMKRKADVIFIETGANDGLRAFPVSAIRSNITKIVRRVKEKQPDARIVLVPMQMPPNFGSAYTRDFQNMYQQIAREENVILAPFLLEGVGGDPELNQDDGIHPNAQGAQILAQNIWRVLAPLLN